MLASILNSSAAWIVVWIAVVAGLAFACDAIGASPQERLMRQRRRHAERTARAMRRMTKIRQQTVERIDRASERGRS
jgi:hypothetical protein